MSRSERRKRELQIKVRVDKEEKFFLENRAKGVGKSTAAYLRDLAMEYPLRSVVDQYALDVLIKTKADLGRLGGLFKIWLTNNEEYKENVKLGKYDYKTVEALLEKIEERQERLIEIAEKLL